jgi:hypothetical protein
MIKPCFFDIVVTYGKVIIGTNSLLVTTGTMLHKAAKVKVLILK